MSEIVPASTDTPARVDRSDLARSPAAVYLASLPSAHSRRAMGDALTKMARLLSG